MKCQWDIEEVIEYFSSPDTSRPCLLEADKHCRLCATGLRCPHDKMQ